MKKIMNCTFCGKLDFCEFVNLEGKKQHELCRLCIKVIEQSLDNEVTSNIYKAFLK